VGSLRALNKNELTVECLTQIAVQLWSLKNSIWNLTEDWKTSFHKENKERILDYTIAKTSRHGIRGFAPMGLRFIGVKLQYGSFGWRLATCFYATVNNRLYWHHSSVEYFECYENLEPSDLLDIISLRDLDSKLWADFKNFKDLVFEWSLITRDLKSVFRGE
jgi:hypothetical protein